MSWIEHAERIAYFAAAVAAHFWGWRTVGAKLEKRIEEKLDKIVHDQHVAEDERKHAEISAALARGA